MILLKVQIYLLQIVKLNKTENGLMCLDVTIMLTTNTTELNYNHYKKLSAEFPENYILYGIMKYWEYKYNQESELIR